MACVDVGSVNNFLANNIQVMNEKTYKIKTLKKPKAKDFNSEKIKTVKIDEQIFIFPE